MNEKTTRIIRWIARIWAVTVVAIIAFIFISHVIEDGIGPEFNLNLRDSLMMVSGTCLEPHFVSIRNRLRIAFLI